MQPETNENRQLALDRLMSRAARPHQPSRASGRFYANAAETKRKPAVSDVPNDELTGKTYNE
jgi:hypothetical protein